MDIEWMQARIAELERVNAALVAERDAEVERRVMLDALLQSERTRSEQLEADYIILRDLGLDHDPENVYGPLDPETEAGLREWIRALAEDDDDEAPLGWQPGDNAESRTTVGAGYARGEG